MEYKYLIEEKANIHLTFNDIVNNASVCILNIICYHIESQHKYPYLQFMMEKIPFCNNIVKEQLTFPYVFIRNNSDNIGEIVLKKVKLGLGVINCDYDKLTEQMYKGIIFDKNGIPYALVNISGINISCINLTRQTTCWFVLPSEIINIKKICNIDIDCEITNLFTETPYLALLCDKNNKPYIIPDAVYTGCEMKEAEFKAIFGNIKTKIYSSCGKYYFFYRSFSDAVKDGGWSKEEVPTKIGGREIVEIDSNKYISGYINRYALFVEGKMCFEHEIEFGLTDDKIENQYPEPCIIICYIGNHNIKPDMLVKTNESFVSLSYHKLNKKSLDEYFVEKSKMNYMIE